MAEKPGRITEHGHSCPQRAPKFPDPTELLSAARHKYGDVAQVSNLLYRVDFQGVRGKVFPCGRLSTLPRLALAARDNRDAALTLFLT
jgi:hypothetical protein